MAECIIGPSVGKNGYARFPGGKRGLRFYAHRVVWERAHGPIPEKHHVHHTCGNKACVNVEHLELHTPTSHHAQHRTCDHEDRYVRADGRSSCRVCARERNRPRERERYRTDPEFRAKKIARSVTYKRKRRGVVA